MKTNLKFKLLSPLSHFSDEREGTMQLMRNMKFKYNDEFIYIPVYTGNAFRGQIRRIAMEDYLDRLGIKNEGVSAKLYYTLFSGGALTGGSRYDEIGDKREMRRLCPPLALFGTALKDQIPEGKMKIGIFKVICKEMSDYTGIESNISFWEMLEENFYTRRDDLKSNCFNINDDDKFNNAVQMKYEMQNLSAGSELIGNIIIENDNEIDRACLQSIIDNFKKIPYIGGKSATGHGEVELFMNDIASSQDYYKYIDNNKEDMIKWIRIVEGVL